MTLVVYTGKRYTCANTSDEYGLAGSVKAIQPNWFWRNVNNNMPKLWACISCVNYVIVKLSESLD